MSTDTVAPADAPVEETWTYAGRRILNGKRCGLWLGPDGCEYRYAKLPATVIGGKYLVKVRREGGATFAVGDPVYLGEWVSERAAMEAADAVTMARLAAQTRARNDARQGALDDALAPLIAIAANIPFGHERDAFLATVIRRITHPW